MAVTSAVRAPSGTALPLRVRAGWVVLLLAPLALWPWASEPYALPKAAAAAIGAALVLSGPRASRLLPLLSLIVALALGVLLVAALASETPVAAIVGRYPRYEGAYVVATYVAVLAAGARLRPHLHDLRALTTSVLGVSSVAVLVIAVVESGGGSERAGSLLGNATDLGVWGALAALWLVGLAQDLAPRWRTGSWVGAGAAAACTAVSGSRSAVIALVVGLVALLVLRRRDRPLLWAAAALLAAVPLLVVLAPGAAARFTASDPVASATAEGRALLLEDSARLVLAHPLLGVGPSSYVDRIGAAHDARWAAEVGPQAPPDTPHALLLQAASAGGLAVAALLLAAAAVVAVAAWRAAKESAAIAGCAAAVAAYAVAVSVNFTTPSTTTFACLSIGLVAAVPTGAPRRRIATLLPAAVASVCAAVLVLAVAGEVLVGRADSATAAGDLAAAEQAWDAAAALRPGDVDLALRRARSATSAVDAGLAPRTACLAPTAEAARLLPLSSEAAADRAHCLEVNGLWVDAESVLAAAVANDPVNVDLWLLRGVIAAEGGDTAAAIGHLQRAAALRPSASEPWANLAVVHGLRGETDLAAEADRRAAELRAAGG